MCCIFISKLKKHVCIVFGYQDIVAATAALEEVKQSGKFAKVLELILLMGNYMNAGSRNEQTVGFEFNFITKVSCSLEFYDSNLLVFIPLQLDNKGLAVWITVHRHGSDLNLLPSSALVWTIANILFVSTLHNCKMVQ